MNKLKIKRSNKTKKNKSKKRVRGGDNKKYYNRFMKNSRKKKLLAHTQNRETNLSKMLNVACKNPDNCLAVGPYDASIKIFFEDFRNLSFIDTSKVKRIGTPSNNGFIIELPFKKLNYTAYTVLKCSAHKGADNLAYEYYVGKKFINNYIKILPCFVETYDLYEFASETDYNTVFDAVKNRTINTINIQHLIHRVDTERISINDFFEKSCVKNKQLCVLIQHFDKFTSLYDLITNDFDNIKYDLYNMIYQLYYSLSYLGSNYTHYDLHSNNVFLYKPFDGNKYILMRYHSSSKIFEFKSEYILKIIDYGRNYFNNGRITSKYIIKELICPNANCDPMCGKEVGYLDIQGSADPNFNPLDSYWIDPIKPNLSHDLRALKYVKSWIPPFIKLTYLTRFGTPENNTGKLNDIKNIFNAADTFEDFLDGFNQQKSHKKYDSSWHQAATMDIYEDGRDYEFTVMADIAPAIQTPAVQTPAVQTPAYAP
jgi:hypothetical protein